MLINSFVDWLFECKNSNNLFRYQRDRSITSSRLSKKCNTMSSLNTLVKVWQWLLSWMWLDLNPFMHRVVNLIYTFCIFVQFQFKRIITIKCHFFNFCFMCTNIKITVFICCEKSRRRFGSIFFANVDRKKWHINRFKYQMLLLLYNAKYLPFAKYT